MINRKRASSARSGISMSNAAGLAAFVFLCLPAHGESSKHAVMSEPPEIWYAILLSGQPVGGVHELNSSVLYDGRKCMLSTSESETSILLFGTHVSQGIKSRDWSDAVTGRPVYEEVVMSSGGDTTTVTASFTATSVTAVLDSGGRKETHVLTVPVGSVLLADDPMMSSPTDSKKPCVYFDSESLSLQPVTVRAARGSNASSPKRLIVSMASGTVTVERDSNGTPVKLYLPGGLEMLREQGTLVSGYMQGSHSVDLSASAGAPPDFAVVTSVVPKGKPLLQNPSKLIATVSQVDKPTATYTVEKMPVPPPGTLTDTLDTLRDRPDLLSGLANSSYLSLDSGGIAAQSREIAGGRTNLYDIAVQIEKWVHESMNPTPTIGLPRSAADILANPQGVCRDYALLYTALARKAGLPTHLCAGLVGYRGRFYYHAWAESYVGGTVGWMPFDPTLYQIPVDASHIPLVKGDPANLYDLVGRIGGIGVNIIDCEQ